MIKAKHLLSGSLVLVALVGGLAVIETQQPTTASAVTKGTPKALRGKFQYNLPKHSALGFGEIITINAKYLIDQASGMPQVKVKNTYYVKRGKYYHLKGTGIKSGMYLGGTENYMIYRKGKYLKLVPYSYYQKHGFKHTETAHLIK